MRNIIVAIHDRPGSFSDRWIDYCKNNAIEFKIVDCYRSDVIQQIKECAGLMWHFSQSHIEDMLISHAVLNSVAAMDIRTFPNHSTSWHFDDKISQKYLLEAINARLVPTYVFVEKRKAMEWAANTDYPKVFKLTGGAGSSNVSLARNYAAARKLIKKAFSSGFPPIPRWQPLQERWWHFKRDKTFSSLINIGRGLIRTVIRNPTLDRLPRESGYAYFQDFIPNNDSDIRVVVIGKRAFAIKRMVREGDFRASGSGRIVYDPEAIPKECLKLSFELAAKLGTQSLALDFVFLEGTPLVVEMSYAFMSSGYEACPGYWKQDLSWVEGRFIPENFMIEDFLTSLSESQP